MVINKFIIFIFKCKTSEITKCLINVNWSVMNDTSIKQVIIIIKTTILITKQTPKPERENKHNWSSQ